ncbi:MAG: hypothetical protein V4515_14440 [Chloroflexota bacterium]
MFAIDRAAVSATPDPADLAVKSACASGWYVNPDEADRKPEALEAGFRFTGDDLVHHAATGTVADLAAGTFVAAPAPDQPSFFSVEVRNPDNTGYATLRWNAAASKWTMVTGGQAYENATAAGLVAMTTPPKSSALMSFGVGYTKNPPGTVAVTVSKVTFKGQAYDLTCAPKPTTSSQSSAASASAKPSTSASTAGATLPLTGASDNPVPWLIGAGLVLLVAGTAAVLSVRRASRIEYRA